MDAIDSACCRSSSASRVPRKTGFLDESEAFEFTSQAIVAEPSGLLLTNPDCKEIRS